MCRKGSALTHRLRQLVLWTMPRIVPHHHAVSPSIGHQPVTRSGTDRDVATPTGREWPPVDNTDHKRTARDENGPSEDVVSGADPGRPEAKVSQIFYT